MPGNQPAVSPPATGPSPLGLPSSVDEAHELLAKGRYVADRSLATVLYLALPRQRPLFLEGEAGVGKTEIAKVLAEVLGRRLLRLQCYEGLDVSSAVYEWNYPRQMVEIRIAEAAGERDRESLSTDIFDEKFLIERPLLQALRPGLEGPPVLLIDELDRSKIERLLPALHVDTGARHERETRLANGLLHRRPRDLAEVGHLDRLVISGDAAREPLKTIDWHGR